MIERLLRKVLRFSTAGPALTRYYLIPRVKLHRIHSSDAEFHTHPWNGISFILGWYYEERGSDKKRLKLFVNRVFANIPHKVTIVFPVWTLFIHGKRINESWSYGKATKPWEGSDQERENAEHHQNDSFIEAENQAKKDSLEICPKCEGTEWTPIPDSLAQFCTCGFVRIKERGENYSEGISLQQWAADLSEHYSKTEPKD